VELLDSEAVEPAVHEDDRTTATATASSCVCPGDREALSVFAASPEGRRKTAHYRDLGRSDEDDAASMATGSSCVCPGPAAAATTTRAASQEHVAPGVSSPAEGWELTEMRKGWQRGDATGPSSSGSPQV